MFWYLVGFILFFGLYKGALDVRMLPLAEYKENVETELKAYDLSKAEEDSYRHRMILRYYVIIYWGATVLSILTLLAIPIIWHNVWFSLGILLTLIALPYIIRWSRIISRRV